MYRILNAEGKGCNTPLGILFEGGVLYFQVTQKSGALFEEDFVEHGIYSRTLFTLLTN